MHSVVSFFRTPLSRVLLIPAIISALICAVAGFAYGWVALATVLLLVVLEVTLSFDNAVVNAKVLEGMDAKWRHRFLTWGIIIAVFLTRAVLPIVIVSLSVSALPWDVAYIALKDPIRYAELLEQAEYIIGSFGAMFLTMAGLRYFFDAKKERHWIPGVERYLASWGSVEAIELMTALIILFSVSVALPAHSTEILLAGIVGIVLFAMVQAVATAFSRETIGATGSGLALFAYLNVLDAAFSLDSVVGAFALSKEIVIIVIGLGIGAYFVRSLTIYMVEHGTLAALVYLEHGAHWAILGLAAAMLANMFVHIPDPVTGFIGLLFVGAAYVSSIRIVEEPKLG